MCILENLQIPPELMAFIPVMMIIIRAIKATPAWKYVRKWVSIISLVIGVAFSFIAMPKGAAVSTVILGGLLLGASPVGVHEAIKK